MDKVSIIIPVYNVEKNLSKCVESIINQTYKNIEIILINDGSTDTSSKIIEEYSKKDKRIIVINEKNKGPSAARNAGLKIATGEYVTFIDADDYIDSEMVENIVRVFKESKCDVVRSNYTYTYDNKEKKNNENLKGIADKLYILTNNREKLIKKIFLGEIQSYSWTLAIRRNILEKNNIYFSEDVPFMEDIVFLVKLIFFIDNIFFVNKTYYHYYQNNSNSLTKNYKNYVRNMNNILIVKKKIESILLNNLKEADEYIKIINTIYISGIVEYLGVSIKSGQSYKEIARELERIRENEIMKEMLSNKSLKVLQIHFRLHVYLFEKRKYNFLIKIYKIENKIRILKGKS